MKVLFTILSIFVLLSNFLPILTSNHWFVRGFDFPRIQILTITFLYLIFSLYYLNKKNSKIFVLLFCLVAFGIDAYRITPYTIFHDPESKKMSEKVSNFKILSLNIKMSNNRYENIIEMVKENNPDIFLALETDEKWTMQLKNLNEKYKYKVEVPQENTYGMVLLSKYPLINEKVRFLIDKKVPSIFTDVQIKNNLIKLICLHPRPPRPSEGSSVQRDGELVKVAKIVKDIKNMPVLIIGDLNDVAWSHTTRLFKRLSRTLDPRVGRGFFNTYPADLKFLSFPLDHVFHNQHLDLTEIDVLEDVGSDHLPITASFNISHNVHKKVPRADAEDQKEAHEISNTAKKWDGPNEKVGE